MALDSDLPGSDAAIKPLGSTRPPRPHGTDPCPTIAAIDIDPQ